MESPLVFSFGVGARSGAPIDHQCRVGDVGWEDGRCRRLQFFTVALNSPHVVDGAGHCRNLCKNLLPEFTIPLMSVYTRDT